MLTSGSTGTPKAVAISQRLLSERIGRHLTVFGNRLPRCDRFYCGMPISTSLGFQFLIYSLLRGGTIVFPGERFDATLLAIEEYKVQCLMASPDGLETFVQWFDTIPAYQSNIELILCCRQRPSASLSNDVRARICSHLVVAYDLTEASMIAAAPAHEIAGAPRRGRLRDAGYRCPDRRPVWNGASTGPGRARSDQERLRGRRLSRQSRGNGADFPRRDGSTRATPAR